MATSHSKDGIASGPPRVTQTVALEISCLEWMQD